jgi:hypothetical protein
MSRRPSIRRELSSKSLLASPPLTARRTQDALSDDGYSVGDSELHIEYYNVPRRLLLQGTLHSLIQFRFFPLLLVIISTILLLVSIFAGLYLSVSEDCGLELSAYKDAFLFAMLANSKTVLGPADPTRRFWNGCVTGGTVFFFHLFCAQILTSVLLSSLAFNFQSISRRSISMFNTVTMGQRMRVSKEFSGEEVKAFLNVSVVELNEASYRKVAKVTANVFMFDPADGSVKTIAVNQTIGEVFLPQNLQIELPSYVLDSSRPKSQECDVCGKDCEGKLRKHLQSMTDPKHKSVLSNFPILALPAVENIVKSLRERQLQFIVVIEGSDPVTTDRVQVQKIYRSYEIVSDGNDTSVSIDDDNRLSVDYKTFL